ncbi:MAG TPA: GGDEF domain-containing protein [Usitatibacter sp.]|nr:GGDEF domain-containing protein [Usitatibacter sp.]
MIDLRTLLALLAVTDLAVAAALWVGGSRRLGDGLSQWAASLLLRALACGVLASGAVPQAGVIALGAALLALSCTLQAAAIAAYDHRPLPAWLHTAVIAAVAAPMPLLVGEIPLAILFGGVMFGTLFAAGAAIASQVRSPKHSAARRILIASLGCGAAALYLRGVSAMLSPAAASVSAPEGFAAATLLVVFGASLAASFGFVLLHKERAEAEAFRLATTDPLTGAYNRRTFHEIAERELSRVRRGGQPLSIVMIDVDHLRQVNEKHGHRVGDAVLQKVAEVVRGAMRKEDMLVRFGGEEFLVLLPDVPGPGAVVVAGRVRRTVANQPLVVGDLELPVTVSLGVAARMDEGPESIEGLLARADSALALAKQRGRNRVVALSLGRSIAA